MQFFASRGSTPQERIQAMSMPEPNTGCWLWMATASKDGYGKITIAGKRLLAHRVSYETFVGPIPNDFTLDHLCKTTFCVNPKHLEPATVRENILRSDGRTAKQARQTHCLRGHELSGNNLYVHQGIRHCKSCRNIRKRGRR